MARNHRSFWIVLSLLASGCARNPVDDLVLRLKEDDVDARRHAARSLGDIGPAATPAVSMLVEATADRDSEVRRLAAHALGEIGSPTAAAKTALLTLLKDPVLSVRLSAAFAIEKIAPDEDSHIPLLVGAMRLGEGGVIVKVAEMGDRGRWAVPTLTSLLRDRRPGVRRLAAEALGKIGPDEAAESALRQALRDPDDRVREAARQSIGTSEPTASD